ncbi:MAG: hypothetical protein IKV97_04860 [Clostridia bacterium]|nr:hypothetical protein [Clostridia bacterium]
MINIGNVFILGDSYSTFKGYIPDGYAAYYSENPVDGMDVVKVEETWWHSLLCATQSNLLLNCSYSGTTICHTGYNGSDCKNISFAARVDKLISEGYFEQNNVDTFLLFGGTNDTWANSPLGELKLSDWSTEELYNVLPALGYLFHRISEKVKAKRVVCIVNTGLKAEIAQTMKELCQKHGFICTELCDINKINGHPNVLGMSQIKEQVLKSLS